MGYELIEPIGDTQALEQMQEDIAAIGDAIKDYPNEWMVVAKSDRYEDVRSLADANWTGAFEEKLKRHKREVAWDGEEWLLFVMYKPPLEAKDTSLIDKASDYERLLCQIIGEGARENGWKVNDHFLRSWLVSARRVFNHALEIGKDEESVIKLAKWALADEFWSRNIRSVPKFHKQYDRLREEANKQAKSPGWANQRKKTEDMWNNITLTQQVEPANTLWDSVISKDEK